MTGDSVFCILKLVSLKDTATRLLTAVVVIAVVTGCDGATTDESDLPEWANSLIAEVEDLTAVESEKLQSLSNSAVTQPLWQTSSRIGWIKGMTSSSTSR